MAASVLSNVQLLVGAYELSAFSGTFEAGGEVEIKEANNFAALGYVVTLPGLFTANGSVGGNADYATGAVNQSFRVAQIGSQQAFSVIPSGTAAVAGDSAQFMRGRLSKMAMLTGAVGEVAKFQIDVTGDYPDVDGFVGVPLGARSSLTGTAVQVGATPATKQVWAALHVTTAVGTNLAVTVTSDNAVGFPSPATVLTFATTSTVGWQFITAAGPITDDWLKVTHSSTGSFTYAVVMGVM
jgi:hypothetical protein